ncbi:basic proline-rich protein-like [Macaca thibetana thibetana]|uniref:basic proline-rich protein-like n=1 Tax=Macaca thibetana thibetana TaxID=257877 RepID=UPI0021BCD8AC|nr:basic proline-rich protein-like [Macaca thibetana thibetana]
MNPNALQPPLSPQSSFRPPARVLEHRRRPWRSLRCLQQPAVTPPRAHPALCPAPPGASPLPLPGGRPSMCPHSPAPSSPPGPRLAAPLRQARPPRLRPRGSRAAAARPTAHRPRPTSPRRPPAAGAGSRSPEGPRPRGLAQHPVFCVEPKAPGVLGSFWAAGWRASPLASVLHRGTSWWSHLLVQWACFPESLQAACYLGEVSVTQKQFAVDPELGGVARIIKTEKRERETRKRENTSLKLRSI